MKLLHVSVLAQLLAFCYAQGGCKDGSCPEPTPDPLHCITKIALEPVGSVETEYTTHTKIVTIERKYEVTETSTAPNPTVTATRTQTDTTTITDKKPVDKCSITITVGESVVVTNTATTMTTTTAIFKTTSTSTVTSVVETPSGFCPVLDTFWSDTDSALLAVRDGPDFDDDSGGCKLEHYPSLIRCTEYQRLTTIESTCVNTASPTTVTPTVTNTIWDSTTVTNTITACGPEISVTVSISVTTTDTSTTTITQTSTETASTTQTMSATVPGPTSYAACRAGSRNFAAPGNNGQYYWNAWNNGCDEASTFTVLSAEDPEECCNACFGDEEHSCTGSLWEDGYCMMLYAEGDGTCKRPDASTAFVGVSDRWGGFTISNGPCGFLIPEDSDCD